MQVCYPLHIYTLILVLQQSVSSFQQRPNVEPNGIARILGSRVIRETRNQISRGGGSELLEASALILLYTYT